MRTDQEILDREQKIWKINLEGVSCKRKGYRENEGNLKSLTRIYRCRRDLEGVERVWGGTV